VLSGTAPDDETASAAPTGEESEAMNHDEILRIAKSELAKHDF